MHLTWHARAGVRFHTLPVVPALEGSAYSAAERGGNVNIRRSGQKYRNAHTNVTIPRGDSFLAYAAVVCLAAAQNASRPELTARELFYNASAPATPAAKTPGQKPPPKQVAKKAPAAAPVNATGGQLLAAYPTIAVCLALDCANRQRVRLRTRSHHRPGACQRNSIGHEIHHPETFRKHDGASGAQLRVPQRRQDSI